jgi:hypothetical protein
MGRTSTYNADDLAIELEIYVDGSDDPYIEEFCLNRGVTRDTIYRLEKTNQHLSDTIKKCHAKQQMRTIRGAENGTINSTFAIFKLKQKCYGWTDKQELDIGNKDDKPFEVNIKVID